MTSSEEAVGIAYVRYFEKDSFIGTREMYCCGFSPGNGAPPVSAHWPHTAYFCPVCGEIWARAVLEHQFNYAPLPAKILWSVEIRRCAEHGDGTLLIGHLTDLERCSQSLLAREALALSMGR